MLFGVDEAQERFEELMARVAAGEEILIGEGDRIARVVPIDAETLEARRRSDTPRPAAAFAADSRK